MFRLLILLLTCSNLLFGQTNKIQPVIQRGHSSTITDLMISSNGLKLISGDTDGKIKIWDIPSNKLIYNLPIQRGGIACLELNSKANVLFSGGYNHHIIIWNLETRKKINQIKGGNDKIIALDLSQNDSLLYSISRNAQLKVWDWKNDTLIRNDTLQLKETIEKAVFIPEKNQILVGTKQGTVLLWDINLKSAIQFRNFQKKRISSMCVNPNKKVALITLEGSKALILNLKTFNVEKDLKGLGGWTFVHDSVFSNDGNKVSVVGEELPNTGLNIVWDIKSGEILLNTRGTIPPIHSVKFSYDNKDLFIGSSFGWLYSTSIKYTPFHFFGVGIETFNKVYFDSNMEQVIMYGDEIKSWDLKTGLISDSVSQNEIRDFPLFMTQKTKSKIDNILNNDYKSSLSDKTIIVKEFYNNYQYLFLNENFLLVKDKNQANQKELKLIDLRKETESKNYVLEANSKLLSIDSKEKYFVTSIQDSTGYALDLWNLESEKKIKRLSGHKEEIYFAAFDSKSKILVSAAKERNHLFLSSPMFSEIICWNIKTGKKAKRIKFPSNIHITDVSPNHKYLAAIKNYTDVVLLKIKNGKERYTIGKNLPVIINEQSIKDTSYFPLLYTEYVDNVQFLVNGKYLLATYSTGRIIIWETKSGKEKFQLGSHTSQITSIDISSDEKFLVSASENEVILWDLSQYTFNLFNLITSNHLATLVHITTQQNQNGYVVYSNENYYLARGDGLNAVAFQANGEIYQFDQFDLHFNQPHKVMANFPLSNESLVKRYRLAYNMHLKANGLSENKQLINPNAPKLEINNLNELTSVKFNRNINIDVSVQDNQYGLNKMLIYVNKVLVSENYAEQVKGKFEDNFSIPLVLLKGVNRIQIAVENEKGFRSLKKSFEVQYEGTPDITNYYIISIGTSNYRDSLNLSNLYYPSRDAKMILKEFKLKFPNAKTLSLVDKEFSKNSLDSISQFLSFSKESDVVLFYLSGHGILDENGIYYYCTNETKLRSLSNSAIPYRDFERILSNCKSRNKLLVLNSCFSGKASLAETYEEQLAFNLSQRIFVNYYSSEGSSIITASGGHETTKAIRGTTLNNGMIAHSIIEALKSNQSFTVSQFFNYLQNEIQSFPPLFGKRSPVLRVENLLHDFKMW